MSANPAAQEVLAYPVWQETMASAAMPAGRNRRRRRFRSEWNSWGQGWGTMMRHFFVFRPVTALALRVGMTASPTGLIAATGATDGGASCLRRTRFGAVALAAIAVAANDHGRTAAGAKVVSSCRFHGQRPMGERQQGPLCEILGRRHCPSGQRGAASELAWSLAPVSRRHLHRRDVLSPHSPYYCYGSAQHADPKPCRTVFARRQFAAQTARRAPCGLPLKTTIDKLKK